MNWIDAILAWASDQSNSTAVRTFVALLAVPGALWGVYLFSKWARGSGLDAQVSQIENRLRELQGAIQTSKKPRARFALLVGNSNYRDAPRLRNPASDVDFVASTLRSNGFATQVIKDATRDDLVKAIDRFRVTAAHGGVGLIYFSGHGLSADGEDYLIPVDAEIKRVHDVKLVAINLTSLLAPIDSFIDEHPKDNGALVLYSTSKAGLAIDGSGDNSPFAQSFVRALGAQHDSLGTFADQVRRQTSELTMAKQTPELASLTDAKFSFANRALDQNSGILKIIIMDAGRNNPFAQHSSVS